SGEWDFGVSVGLGGEENGYPDPENAFTGEYVYGVNLSGDYERTIAGPHYLLAGPIDCTGYAAITLQFQRWLNTDFPPYASITIDVSDDGENWTQIWHKPGNNSYIIDSKWTRCTYGIGDVADNQSAVYIRWGYQTFDGVYSFSGWNIDDIELLGVLIEKLAVTPYMDFETDGYEEGPFQPVSTIYTLTNRSNTPLDWQVQQDAAWLDITDTNGTLAALGQTAISCTVNDEAEALSPGRYVAVLAFTNLTNGFTQEIKAVLQIHRRPGAIQVTDSVIPEDDQIVPFGSVPVDEVREAYIYLENTDTQHDLSIEDLFLGGWYVNDFEEGNAQDWMPVEEERWAVVDGEYRGWAQQYQTTVQSVYTGAAWQDIAMTACMRRTGSPDWVAALFVRASHDFDFATFSGSAYVIGINGNGAYYVMKVAAGGFIWLQPWTASAHLGAGDSTNTVTVSINDDRIQLYANGNLLFADTDASPLAGGTIGIGGYSGNDGPDTIYYFDRISIMSPLPFEELLPKITGTYTGEEGTPYRAPVTMEYPESKSNTVSENNRLLSLFSEFFFLPEAPVLPLTLAPGEQLTLPVYYTPSTAEEHADILYVATNDSVSPRVTVLLSGEGHDPIQLEGELEGEPAEG
ncbi:MAG: hypothetical protein KAH38_00215, partial [Candidatus Hydrogenedentes bacterium]|nr:hypothetical protein [Candidatus Hydrogenedentota bacterium]